MQSPYRSSRVSLPSNIPASDAVTLQEQSCQLTVKHPSLWCSHPTGAVVSGYRQTSQLVIQSPYRSSRVSLPSNIPASDAVTLQEQSCQVTFKHPSFWCSHPTGAVVSGYLQTSQLLMQSPYRSSSVRLPSNIPACDTVTLQEQSCQLTVKHPSLWYSHPTGAVVSGYLQTSQLLMQSPYRSSRVRLPSNIPASDAVTLQEQ